MVDTVPSALGWLAFEMPGDSPVSASHPAEAPLGLQTGTTAKGISGCRTSFLVNESSLQPVFVAAAAASQRVQGGLELSV